MPSKKLEIIYYNGQPDGIRSIRKHLSTMATKMLLRALYLLIFNKHGKTIDTVTNVQIVCGTGMNARRITDP